MFAMQSFGFAHADVTHEVKDRLKQGNKISFRFNDNSIQTAAYLIQHEKGIKVIIDQNVDKKMSFPINLRDQSFLTYLDVTTQRLGLRYEVIDTKTIRVYQ
ncbi:hypothetical protein B9T34_09475 [Acinetobacter sp. ANC 3813]|nr:hypothetical protein B9T34_09475 [Acinetobacter sp. ANC 3813]